MDSGVIWPSNAPLIIGDELWLYYGMGVRSNAMDYVKLPCLENLRRDGFARWVAPESTSAI